MGALAGMEKREEGRRSVRPLRVGRPDRDGDQDPLDVVGGGVTRRGALMARCAAGRPKRNGRASIRWRRSGRVRTNHAAIGATEEVIELGGARTRGRLAGSSSQARSLLRRDSRFLGLGPGTAGPRPGPEEGAEGYRSRTTGRLCPCGKGGTGGPGGGGAGGRWAESAARTAPYAAHGGTGQPGGAVGRHRTLDPGYRTDCRWRHTPAASRSPT